METKWERPSFVEIKMDAELGAYQDDFDPVRDPLFARPDPPAERDPDRATSE